MKNCMLFKKGSLHSFRGIPCEIIKVSASQVKEYKDNGWFSSLDEANADTNDSGKLSNDEVRQAAKEAGLENWESGRIKGLKRDLGYDDN